MPSHGRWGSFKIVESEIFGGMRNALERGQPIQLVKQSFLNAGYSPNEVEEATRELMQGGYLQAQKLPQMTPIKKVGLPSPVISKSAPSIEPEIPLAPLSTQTPQIPQMQYSSSSSVGENKIPRWLIISLIVSGSLIVILAAVLGLLWEKLF